MPHVDGVAHHYIDADGVRIHVAEAGEGEPVVLLHGWPQHWYCWRRVIPGLAERYRVLCPDLRGFGWSEAPGEGYHAARFAADTAAVLDALNLDEVRLVGHDWGGVAGFVLCLERPERVSRYLALNTAHPWINLPPTEIWRVAYQPVLGFPVLGRLVVQHLLERVLDEPSWTAEDKAIFLDQFAESDRASATVALYRSALGQAGARLTGGGPAALRLTVPTLFLLGAADPVIKPRMLEGYEDHAGDMTLEVVEGVGHFIAEQAPDLVLDRALAFFAK
jgi:pimeloyl-ACP methyl ester carboxylesterase